ncbi:four-domain proteases inhibitor-like [Mya arenaria]|uniref:four-domain proteases inhibitor-like n=1 Tax=Mya arenaria TaxID=6604 RepID=UPI0022DF5536|nr:four-domain proteases inhibitor-like [Mya arenaria]
MRTLFVISLLVCAVAVYGDKDCAKCGSGTEFDIYDENCKKYDNTCLLKCAGAKLQKNLVACGVACKCTRELDYQCGDDGTWYVNPCALKCNKDVKLDKKEEGCGAKPGGLFLG